MPVPTFASFLKEVDSPYEVHDYVRAYLGDTPEAKDFAKQFLERRAKQNANQQKQAPQNQQQALKQQQQVSETELKAHMGTKCFGPILPHKAMQEKSLSPSLPKNSFCSFRGSHLT